MSSGQTQDFLSDLSLNGFSRQERPIIFIPSFLFFPFSHPIWNSLAYLLVSLLLDPDYRTHSTRASCSLFDLFSIVASEPGKWCNPNGCSAPTCGLTGGLELKVFTLPSLSIPSSLTYCGSCIMTIWDLGLKHMPWMEVCGSLVPFIWSFWSCSAVDWKQQLHYSPFPRDWQASQD